MPRSSSWHSRPVLEVNIRVRRRTAEESSSFLTEKAFTSTRRWPSFASCLPECPVQRNSSSIVFAEE